MPEPPVPPALPVFDPLTYVDPLTPVAVRSVTKALIYIRVSTPGQALGGVSLALQEERCREYATDQGFEVAGFFQDAISGRRPDRTEYQRFKATVAELRAAGFRVAIIVFKVARFGRSRAENAEMLDRLQADPGLTLHSAENKSEQRGLALEVLMMFAVNESEETSSRVSNAARFTLENGWYWGGAAPWGYRWRPATPEEAAAKGARLLTGRPGEEDRLPKVLDLAEVEAEREAVICLFAQAARGVSIRALVRWMGTLTPEQTGGRKPTFDLIERVLRNPVYVARRPSPEEVSGGTKKYGETTAGKVRHRRLSKQRNIPEAILARPVAKWPALVEEGVWLIVQRRLKSRSLEGQPGNKASGRYDLTGLVRCPRCQSGMVGRLDKGKTAAGEPVERRRYSCSMNPRGECSQVLPADVLEAGALEQARAFLAKLAPATVGGSVLDAKCERLWEQLRRTPELAETQQTIAFHEQEIERMERRRDQIADDWADRRLPGTTYHDDHAQYTRDIERTTQRLSDHRRALTEAQARGAAAGNQLPPWSEVRAMLRDWSDALTREDQVRDVYGELITRLLVRRPPHWQGKRGQWVVKPEWTPLGEAIDQLGSLLIDGPVTTAK